MPPWRKVPKADTYPTPKTGHSFEIRPDVKHESFYDREKADAQNISSGKGEASKVNAVGPTSNPAPAYCKADQTIYNRQKLAQAEKNPYRFDPYAGSEYATDGHTFRSEGLEPDVETDGKVVKD